MMAKPADKNIQSGNSRVKVTIYGQVNRAIRFANTGDATEITSVDNDGSSSRVGFRAVGKANPNLTIGSLTELEWRQNHRSATSEANTGAKPEDMRVRHADVWLDHKNLGKLSMGEGSMAGDAAGLFELTGVSFVYGFAGANGTDGTKADAGVRVLATGGSLPADATGEPGTFETVQATGKARGFRPFNFFGFRQNRIRYDTPSLMGLRASVSYGEAQTWSAGLTYAGAPPGTKDFNVLFAAGFRKNANNTTAFAVSGGVKHSSGFNINGSYDADATVLPNADGVLFKNSQWGVSGGWTGKINDAGGTAIGIGYNRSTDGVHGIAQQYWAAVVQNIDAAAADVYAGISYDSGTVTHTVTAAEALVTDRPADASVVPEVPALAVKGTPCYSAGTDADQYVRAAAGDTCQVARDGVFNFVAGVRIKF
ncbi:MAG: hypothetical protein OXF57_11440 [Rhodospirillaceae bacterium]|nr:hypothetical protein [Rhodospirillaceae bacterium]